VALRGERGPERRTGRVVERVERDGRDVRVLEEDVLVERLLVLLRVALGREGERPLVGMERGEGARLVGGLRGRVLGPPRRRLLPLTTGAGVVHEAGARALIGWRVAQIAEPPAVARIVERARRVDGAAVVGGEPLAVVGDGPEVEPPAGEADG